MALEVVKVLKGCEMKLFDDWNDFREAGLALANGDGAQARTECGICRAVVANFDVDALDSVRNIMKGARHENKSNCNYFCRRRV